MTKVWALVILAFCLAPPSLVAADSEDQAIAELNRLELEALKPSDALDRIDQILKRTDRLTQPRVYWHAFTVLDPARQKATGLTVEEGLKEAQGLGDKVLLLRLWLLDLKDKVAAGVDKATTLNIFRAGDAICEGWQDPLWCGRWQQQVGWQYHVLNDAGAGLKRIEAALKLLEKAPDAYAYFLHEAQTTLALLLEENGQSERAMRLTKENFQWYFDQGYRSEAAYEAYNLAFHAMEREVRDRPLIIAYLEQSEALARGVGNDECLALVLYARGQLAIDEKDYAGALKVLPGAYDLFKKVGNLEFSGLAQIQMARGHLGLNQLGRAKVELDEAERRLPKDYTYEQTRILQLRHQIAKREGDIPLAHSLLEKYVEAFKEQKKEEEKKEMQKLSAQLGLQVEEQRNRVLQQENALQAQKLHEAEIFRVFVFWLGLLSLSTLLLLILALRQTQRIRTSRMKMKRILDHIDEGLLTVDKSLKITDDYSKRLPLILNNPGKLHGEKFVPTIFGASHLSGESKSMIQEVMDAVLGEEKIAWDMNEEHLPREMQLGDQNERIVAVRWIPIFDSSEYLERILVSLTDITHERILEQAYGSQKQYLEALPQALREMLEVDPTRMQHLLKQGRELLLQFDEGGAREGLLRDLHTLKGTARTLGLRAFSQDLHDLESLLQPQTGQTNLGRLLHDHLMQTREHVLEYEALTEVLHSGVRPETGPAWLSQAVTLHLRQWFVVLEKAQLRLAAVVVEDEVMDWEPDDMQLVEQLCLHAVTNSLDHGFILPKEQGRIPNAPRLHFQATIKDARLHLTISDNGVGLDLVRIRALAQQRGFTGERIEDVLFLDGVSTAASVSMSSGRGVGLSAIRALLQERGGDVRLQNRAAGSGAVLSMQWPYGKRSSSVSAQVS